jgi:hypothetical protein
MTDNLEKLIREKWQLMQSCPKAREYQKVIDEALKDAKSFQEKQTILAKMMTDNLLEITKKFEEIKDIVGSDKK